MVSGVGAHCVVHMLHTRPCLYPLGRRHIASVRLSPAPAPSTFNERAAALLMSRLLLLLHLLLLHPFVLLLSATESRREIGLRRIGIARLGLTAHLNCRREVLAQLVVEFGPPSCIVESCMRMMGGGGAGGVYRCMLLLCIRHAGRGREAGRIASEGGVVCGCELGRRLQVRHRLLHLLNDIDGGHEIPTIGVQHRLQAVQVEAGKLGRQDVKRVGAF
mmetsp:Transcript_28550/g.47966  ORF Transcript_28550/g.47966 Transcript_28550/m.47966 type:complete len:218 (-) Transcript_28550:833-1486(-)